MEAAVLSGIGVICISGIAAFGRDTAGCEPEHQRED
jgi:hypothetical protein